MGQKAGYCSVCGTKIVGPSHKLSNEVLCGDCYLKRMQSLEALDKAKKDLYDYLKVLFGKATVPDSVRNAIDRAIASGRTVTGIRFTVYYYYEVQANVPENLNEVPWIIRDHYDEAREYAVSMRRLGEENKNVNVAIEPVCVKIRKPISRKRYRKKIITED